MTKHPPLLLLILSVITTLSAHAFTFDTLPLPDSDEEASRVRVTQAYRHADRRYPLQYHVLINSGESIADQVFGLLIDRQGNPIHSADGRLRISKKNDFSSLLSIGGNLFMLTHIEEIPGAIYLSELTQAPDTGLLRVTRFRPIDLSEVAGGWNHCAGSTTPWQTHLGSEEYEPDAAHPPNSAALDRYLQAMAAYTDGKPGSLNPYDYGWQLEIDVKNFQKVRVSKRYALGRFSHEVGLVMPDRRTVYITDDAYNTAFYRFVAEQPGDLSSGTLFAARWTQTSDREGGSASIDWIDLGHAKETDIAAAIRNKIRFEELFDRLPLSKTARCEKGYTAVNTRFGPECLSVKPGQETLASRLESRRYAALLGATTEFRKMEGLAFDPANRRLFVAISMIDRGMEDQRNQGKTNTDFDLGGPNQIRLEHNPCGAVYQLSLDQHYVAYKMATLLTGRPVDDDPENGCDTESIANPDNLTFIPGAQTLIIAEDSHQGHRHNILWAYDQDMGRLTRLLTAPLGAEVTGSYYYPDVAGRGYLMCTLQHPSEGPALTGYLGPFPPPERRNIRNREGGD
jgi:secreted PhoX family phosphatase